MSAYVESFVPPHRRRSIPLEFVGDDNLGDLACPCSGNGFALGLGDLGDDQPPKPGLLATLAGAVTGIVTGSGSLKSRIAKGAVSSAVQGARFRSQFTSPIYLTPDQLFSGDQQVQPQESQYSFMGVVKPGVEVDTVGGTVKIFPWGEPNDGEYELYVIGGAVLLVLAGVAGCRILGKIGR